MRNGRAFERNGVTGSRNGAGRPAESRRLDGPYVDEVLHETGLVTVGIFRADVSHPSFRDSGPIERPIFVFPRTSVVIQHQGDRPFTTDTCTVTYYNRGQRYTREPMDPRGDRCEWFSVRPDVLLDVLTAVDPAAVDRPEHPFRHAYGPSDAGAYALQRVVVRHLQSEDRPDALAVEEAVMNVLDRVVRMAYGEPAAAVALHGDSPGNPADAVGLAHDARKFFMSRFTDSLCLEDVARALSCSVFHLCRVFRRETGTTLHRYRHQLRLRQSLEHVAEPDSDLTNIAFRLGFSSHSHFTAAFRAAFGATPSVFRCTASSRRLRELAARLT